MAPPRKPLPTSKTRRTPPRSVPRARAERERTADTLDQATQLVTALREDREAALAASIASGNVPSTLSAFHLAPALPFAREYSDPIDLGDFDARFAGMLIVVDLSLPMGVLAPLQRILASSDTSPQAGIARALALREYAARALAAWNLTRFDAMTGQVVPLRQPGDGGIDEIPLRDVLQVVIQAVEAQFAASKNS